MLGNTTNNFNNLMGTLCRLNHTSPSGRSGSNGTSNGTSQANTMAANNKMPPDFSGGINSAPSTLESSFGGFQQNVGQRYAMSDEQTLQMLQMFLSLLEELMGTVVNNSQNNADGKSAAPDAQQPANQPASQQSTQQSPQQPVGQQHSQQSAQQSAGKSNPSVTAGSVTPSGLSSNVAATNNAQSIAPADSVADSAASAPVQKASGGCPFLATESQQGDASGAAGPDGDASGVGAAGSRSADKADNRDIDFSQLSTAERSEMGMNDRERAVMHLWGRQMISAGEQNGGIYTNVLGPDGTGANWPNKEEVALVKELRAMEQERFGTDTGWMLDEMYFDIMKDKTGIDMSARYADRPVNESKGAIDITNDIGTLEQRTGINGFDQGVLRLMGHDALMDGEFDGSVLEYTAGNANALDSNKHSGGNAIEDTVQQLLAEDKADDGQVNGSSIMNHTVKTLDKLYA